MIVTLLLIGAIAAGLVPLIQRDLRLAYERIEARRRWAAMPKLQRTFVQLGEALQRFGVTARAAADGLAAFGAAYGRSVAEYEKRSREQAQRRRGLL